MASPGHEPVEQKSPKHSPSLHVAVGTVVDHAFTVPSGLLSWLLIEDLRNLKYSRSDRWWMAPNRKSPHCSFNEVGNTQHTRPPLLSLAYRSKNCSMSWKTAP
ncbi:hypothetical protein XPA_004336 [Xanthoria parietina]